MFSQRSLFFCQLQPKAQELFGPKQTSSTKRCNGETNCERQKIQAKYSQLRKSETIRGRK